ncbi:MAG: NAD(P)/FAD-dependent oxidoreductase [Acidimicrobiales bacterium]
MVHDVCSAVHLFGVASPALRPLPPGAHGLRFVHPEVPYSTWSTALRRRCCIGRSTRRWRASGPTARRADPRRADGRAGWRSATLLSPLSVPPAVPLELARFATVGLQPAQGRPSVHHDRASGLFAGLAAHSFLSLGAPLSAAYGLVLGALGHVVGWPVVAGGSGRLAEALVDELVAHGGALECDRRVRSLDDLPSGAEVVLDLTPRQVLAVAGERLPARYRRRLAGYRYGPGVHKVDWVLDGPIPWTDPEVGRAGTVHLAGGVDEVAAAEDDVLAGRLPQRPFVLLGQPCAADASRVPAGSTRQPVWAYTHVPNGTAVDVTDRIEARVEAFAPGFRDRIVARHVMGPAAMEAHDANYVGGDINGGVADVAQFVARPTFGLHPWRTPVPGLYLCSASTPPGGGVHGMCGWHAAQEVLRARP